MTISPARLAANQKNAQRSTGPRTEEGKARSRLNAFQHGMAGAGDLVAPGEQLDQQLIDHRTRAFTRELAAPGHLGELLAHRMAVLSVRMEQAADRNNLAVSACIEAGHAEFDADRLTTLEGLIAEVHESPEPCRAIAHLETMPEGLDWLIQHWQSACVALAETPGEIVGPVTRWLGLVQTPEEGAVGLVPAVTAELARLEALVGSPRLDNAALVVAIRREEAGQLASFDPSPAATLARRYEAAAERGMYRALRAIADLRRDQSQGAFDLLPGLPMLAATPPRTTPPSPAPTLDPVPTLAPTVSAPESEPSLGSFRSDLITRVPDCLLPTGDRLEPEFASSPSPRKRPDLRKLDRKRR